MAELESRGYKVVQMWECQWSQLKRNDPAVLDFLNQLDIVPPQNPRDAFYGGRTNVIKLYHQTEADEKVDYYDFTFNKKGLYPIGHSDIIFEPDTDIFQYFGLAQCTVLPPHGLYYKVPPLRQNGKLTFPLWRTCVK